MKSERNVKQNKTANELMCFAPRCSCFFVALQFFVVKSFGFRISAICSVQKTVKFVATKLVGILLRLIGGKNGESWIFRDTVGTAVIGVMANNFHGVSVRTCAAADPTACWRNCVFVSLTYTVYTLTETRFFSFASLQTTVFDYTQGSH